LFPDKPIRKVTLGRQCVVCKAQTDRTEQMIPVEAEDIPPVKHIAQVPRRVLHRTERHADQRVAVRVAARGAGQVGRDAGQAGPRDPRHVRANALTLTPAASKPAGNRSFAQLSALRDANSPMLQLSGVSGSLELG
jgi:hypothetical protein